MLKRLLGLFLTDTTQDTVIVFVGTIINSIIGGFFYILTARVLGPSNYGIFAVVTSTGILAANLANFGIDTGILRFINNNKESNARILKLALEAYLVIGVFTLVLGFLISDLLSAILGYPNIAPLLKIAFAGVILILMVDFFIAVLQSKREFLKSTLVTTAENTARLILLILAAYFFTINLYFLTALFFFITVVSTTVGKFFVPFDFLLAENHRSEFKIFFSFNIWVAVSMAISSIPFDNYFLLKFASPVAVGLYAAPFKILSVFNQFGGNFSRVLSTRLTSLKSNEEAKIFIRKTIPLVLAVCFGILAIGFVADPVVKILLGVKYQSSVLVFRIIAVTFSLIFAHTIPVSIVVYYLKNSKVAFIITLIVTVLWIILNAVLIPKYQSEGAALALLIDEIVSLFMFSTYIIFKFQNEH